MGVNPNEQQPAGLPAVVVPGTPLPLTTNVLRAQDAMERAKNALGRARLARYRINVHKASLLAEASAGSGDANESPLDAETRLAALSLINHQAGLCDKAVERCVVWERRTRKRAEKVIAYEHDHASLVKCVRYAHVAEKAAARCEGQAYWADYYRIEGNRDELTDKEANTETPSEE